MFEEARNESLYQLVKRHYTFGDRYSYIPVDVTLPVALQDSRGLSLVNDREKDDEYIIKQLELDEKDRKRISEISWHASLMSHHVDIGFRVPKLMKHYRDAGKITLGLDISHINVSEAARLGYEARTADLSVPIELEKPAGNCLFTCYHVLEHTYDPVTALKNIISMMTDRSVLHIEIPIEPGIPRLRYGHMSEFHHGDLRIMLEKLGMCVELKESSNEIERYIAIPIVELNQ